MTDAKQLEADLAHLWENFRVHPTYLQMQLSDLRHLAKTRNDMKGYVLTFLRDTKDLPGEAIAVMTPGSVTLLVDEDGEPLQFA